MLRQTGQILSNAPWIMPSAHFTVL